MYKRMVAVLLLLIYILSVVCAIQVTDTPSSVTSNNDTLIGMKAELNNKIDLLNSKLDTFATKDQVLNLLQGHLTKVNEIQEAFRISLIVNFIVIGLAMLGLGYGVFFHFKSKGRL